jgi:heptosyltransferase-2
VVLARQGIADLYRGQSFAARLLPMQPDHRGILGPERLARELSREKFDLAILFPNSFASAWMIWRAGIHERVGYARDARQWLLTQSIPVPRPAAIPAHESYYYLELLRRAGWLDELPEVTAIRLRVDPAAVARSEEMLRQAGLPSRSREQLRVIMAAGASYGSAKCWLPERYASLADRLIAEFDARVILCGTAGESQIVARIAAGMRCRPVNLVGRTSPGDLPGLFASCDLFVGNDSGAMHVAAAVGLPVVAIFGPTDPEGSASDATPRHRSAARFMQPMFLASLSCGPSLYDAGR